MTTPPLPRPLRVAVTGASGLVGGRLAEALAARGHAVVGLSRSANRAGQGRAGVAWAAYDPRDPSSLASALRGSDAVVHLAGESLFGRRWNDATMEEIRASRVEATKALVAALDALGPSRPRTLVSASAVGYYGPTDPDATVDETAPAGEDFLAGVCRGWEEAAQGAAALGVRVVLARIGIVLARGGGALAKMRLPFSLGLGGPIGRGRQVMSWIHVDDLVAMLVAMVEDDRWRGPINATAPHPASSRQFARALGRALRRPAFLPTPGLGLRLLLGKVASILTTGQRVLPRAAERLGFTWRHPRIEEALESLVRAS